MGTLPYDAANLTALLAANLVYEFISLDALNRRTRRNRGYDTQQAMTLTTQRYCRGILSPS